MDTNESLAELANVSSSYLYKIVEQNFQTSPMKVVLQIRMRKSTTFLTHTDLSLDAIAAEVGYQSPYAFSNAFYREKGIRPGAYRDQILRALKH